MAKRTGLLNAEKVYSKKELLECSRVVLMRYAENRWELPRSASAAGHTKADKNAVYTGSRSSEGLIELIWEKYVDEGVAEGNSLVDGVDGGEEEEEEEKKEAPKKKKTTKKGNGVHPGKTGKRGEKADAEKAKAEEKKKHRDTDQQADTDLEGRLNAQRGQDLAMTMKRLNEKFNEAEAERALTGEAVGMVLTVLGERVLPALRKIAVLTAAGVSEMKGFPTLEDDEVEAELDELLQLLDYVIEVPASSKSKMKSAVTDLVDGVESEEDDDEPEKDQLDPDKEFEFEVDDELWTFKGAELTNRKAWPLKKLAKLGDVMALNIRKMKRPQAVQVLSDALASGEWDE